MSVEHPPISNIEIELAGDDIQKIGKRLRAPQHEAEFSVVMAQIGSGQSCSESMLGMSTTGRKSEQ
jgi:hypothetical protein